MFRRLINKILKPIPSRIVSSYAKTTFSQCGEDSIVEYIFRLRGIQNPTYLDIGAHHPFYLSNTALFYETGSRGINIEANPNLIGEFFLHRPEDVNLNLGISAVKSEMDFFILSDPSLSTFSGEEAKKTAIDGKIRIIETRKIILETVGDILSKYNNNIFPDFMSLDVEGLDTEIIKSIHFKKIWPKVICIEAAEYSPIGTGARKSDLIDYIVAQGYYEYANTNLNSILVKNEFWFI